MQIIKKSDENDILFKKAEVIADNELQYYIDLLQWHIDEVRVIWYGLALPQINISKRWFLMVYKDIEMVILNPKIVRKSWVKKRMTEWCLSIPWLKKDKVRSDVIAIEYIDQNLVRQTHSFKGMLARIVQHEIDHLDWILIA